MTLQHSVSNLRSQQDTYVPSKLIWQVIAMQKQLSAVPDAMNFLLWCYPCMRVEEGRLAFQSNFWATFTHTFTHTLATATGWVIYSTCGRFCFTTARIGSYTLFLLPLQSKWHDYALFLCDPLSENRHIPHFTKIEIRLEIGISMFNCPAVKKWKRSVAWFPSYGAKRIKDTECKFSRKRNVFMLLW